VFLFDKLWQGVTATHAGVRLHSSGKKQMDFGACQCQLCSEAPEPTIWHDNGNWQVKQSFCVRKAKML
jgi:hypothetical protein